MIERPEESEKALLSCIMNYHDSYDDVKAILKPEFMHPKTRTIYSVISDIVKAGGAPDAFTVTAKVHDDLLVYASEINSIIATPKTIDYHAKQIDNYITRVKLSRLADKIPSLIARKDIDSNGILSEFESQLLDMQSDKPTGYVNSVELVKRTIRKIEDNKNGVSYPFSGLDNLDYMLKGFKEQKLYVIGARPGVGKTALTVTMIRNMVRNNHKVGMFSAEMDMESIAMRYIAVDSDTKVTKIESGYADAKVADSVYSLGDSCLFFINDRPNIPLADLTREAKSMRRKEGIHILFVDYISLLTLPDIDAKMWEKVGIISKTLKQLARELEIPVVGLTQVTRDSQGHRPTLANIRHSGSIEEDADCVMFLHTDDDSDNDYIPVECIVAKNRGGVLGSADLMFRKSLTKFYSKDKK